MESREKIIERVKNLLDMANDTSSPNEAAIAARRARSMMDKHQVMLHEIGATKDEFDKTPVGKAYKFMPHWKGILSVSVAKYNDCIATLGWEWVEINGAGTARKRVFFSGYRSDVIVASAMYEYLCNTIDRLCSAYLKELGHTTYLAKLGDAYKNGAVTTLVSRFKEMMADRNAEMQTSAGTSLMVIKSQLVAKHFGAPQYVNKTIKTKSDYDVVSAQHRGRMDGANIPLNTTIHGEASREKLTA